MGAICCLEKKGLPLHQGSSQNDDRRGQTFSKVLKEREIGQIKILEVQEWSFYKRKFKCALKRTVCLYKISTRRDFSDRRGELRIQRGQFKNRRGASFLKSWARLETTGQSSFPDLFALVTCNLCTRRSSEIEEASSEIEEASCFSRHVSTHHTQTQLCGNHG
ncbi:hypothetical protein PS2_013983 [Malus domestica]